MLTQANQINKKTYILYFYQFNNMTQNNITIYINLKHIISPDMKNKEILITLLTTQLAFFQKLKSCIPKNNYLAVILTLLTSPKIVDLSHHIGHNLNKFNKKIQIFTFTICLSFQLLLCLKNNNNKKYVQHALG